MPTNIQRSCKVAPIFALLTWTFCIWALLGIALAVLLSHGLLLLFSTENTLPQFDLSLDWRVLSFVGSIAMLTCIIFAL